MACYVRWNIQPEGTVKLQGIPGYLPGTPARELQPGMVTMWNGGFKDLITQVEHSKTGKTVTVTLKSLDSGYIGTRNFRADRLVVVVK